VALFSVTEDGGFQRWDAHMPPRRGLPGDPLPAGEVFSLPYYMARAFDLFRTLVLDTTVDGRGLGPQPTSEGTSDPVGAVTYLARLGTFATAATLAEGLGVLATILGSASSSASLSLLKEAEAVCSRLRLWLEDRWLAEDQHRFLWEVADLTLASLV